MPNSNPIVLYCQRIFALDLRSLALFRMLLGALILADLAFRLPSLVDMLTSDGLFTRELSFRFYDVHQTGDWPSCIWSLFWISDSPTYVYSLFAVAAAAAVLLILGKWTKLATIVCWLVIASLHVRNPMVTSSGDFMFKMMLLWSVFLPLDSKWSLARRFATGKSKQIGRTVVSIATAGYLFQLFALYFFSGIAKWNDVWLSGEAMEYVLRLDIYIRDFGSALLQYPRLLKFASILTLFAEVALIWTLFIAWKNSFWRLFTMLLFMLFHVGIAFSLGIGLFSWICIIAWVPLIPTRIWGSTSRPLPGRQRNADLNRSADQLDEHISSKQEDSTVQVAGGMFCAALLSLTLVWNLSNIPIARNLRLPVLDQLGHQLAVDQHFQMFGEPPTENPWFVYEGRLQNGEQIDLWTNNAVDHNKPDSGLKVFPQFHWRKFHRNALHKGNQFVHQPLLDFAVKRWNDRHGEEEQVVSARLINYREPIGPGYNSTDQVSQVWATYQNSQSPGSLFDSLLDEDDFPF